MRRCFERLLAVALAGALAVAGCSKPESAEHAPATSTPAAPPKKDPAAARRLIAAGAVVLDVRTPEEYADGHVPNAVNVPVHDVTARLAEIDKLVGGDRSRPVVVYCASGARAGDAKTQLEAAGYSHVVNGRGLGDLQ